MTQLEMIKNLVELMDVAIRSGDWKVDGACDPDSLLNEANNMLRTAGYTRDHITGGGGKLSARRIPDSAGPQGGVL